MFFKNDTTGVLIIKVPKHPQLLFPLIANSKLKNIKMIIRASIKTYIDVFFR
jgi:hypothetical protein